MDWIGSGIEDKLCEWLEAAQRERYASEHALDLFATSMRDFDDVSDDLKTIKSGGQSDRNRWGQRLTDLKNAGLLSDDRRSLSDLGEATLAAWMNFGCDNNSKNSELARHLLLVLEGVRLNSEIINGRLEYWKELRGSFDPFELIDNWDSLFCINFLDYDRAGFAPGNHLRNEHFVVESIELGLTEFAERFDASQAALAGADKIEQACDGRVPRGRHRATFAMALEIAITNGSAARELLDRFGFPKRPRVWDHFEEEVVDQILGILGKYGLAAAPSTALADSGAEANAGQPSVLIGDDFAPAPEGAQVGNVDFATAQKAVPAGSLQRARTGVRLQGRRKIDYPALAKVNKTIGDLGEQLVLEYEKWRLRSKPELAAKVTHVAQDDDSLGYDIRSFNLDGSDRFVEVKSTTGPLNKEFFITANELEVARSCGVSFVIVRVAGLADDPIFCEISFPFDGALEFEPAAYVARFRSVVS